ncbi:unnamed protein product [Amoebophrya sp. A25]|nr:unnamed protein product [Amoebophrya sp. A25]|eukprot:GSA25T00005436001.1
MLKNGAAAISGSKGSETAPAKTVEQGQSVPEVKTASKLSAAAKEWHPPSKSSTQANSAAGAAAAPAQLVSGQPQYVLVTDPVTGAQVLDLVRPDSAALQQSGNAVVLDGSAVMNSLGGSLVSALGGELAGLQQQQQHQQQQAQAAQAAAAGGLFLPAQHFALQQQAAAAAASPNLFTAEQLLAAQPLAAQQSAFFLNNGQLVTAAPAPANPTYVFVDEAGNLQQLVLDQPQLGTSTLQVGPGGALYAVPQGTTNMVSSTGAKLSKGDQQATQHGGKGHHSNNATSTTVLSKGKVGKNYNAHPGVAEQHQQWQQAGSWNNGYNQTAFFTGSWNNSYYHAAGGFASGKGAVAKGQGKHHTANYQQQSTTDYRSEISGARICPPVHGVTQEERDTHMIHFHKTWNVMTDVWRRFGNVIVQKAISGAAAGTSKNNVESSEADKKTKNKESGSDKKEVKLRFYDFGAAPGGFCCHLLEQKEFSHGYGISLPAGLGGYHMCISHETRLHIYLQDIFNVVNSAGLNNLKVEEKDVVAVKAKKGDKKAPKTSPAAKPVDSTEKEAKKKSEESEKQGDSIPVEEKAEEEEGTLPSRLVNLINCDMQDLRMQRDQKQAVARGKVRVTGRAVQTLPIWALTIKQFALGLGALEQGGSLIFRFGWRGYVEEQTWYQECSMVLFLFLRNLFEQVKPYKSEYENNADTTFYAVCMGFDRSKFLSSDLNKKVVPYVRNEVAYVHGYNSRAYRLHKEEISKAQRVAEFNQLAKKKKEEESGKKWIATSVVEAKKEKKRQDGERGSSAASASKDSADAGDSSDAPVPVKNMSGTPTEEDVEQSTQVAMAETICASSEQSIESSPARPAETETTPLSANKHADVTTEQEFVSPEPKIDSASKDESTACDDNSSSKSMAEITTATTATTGKLESKEMTEWTAVNYYDILLRLAEIIRHDLSAEEELLTLLSDTLVDAEDLSALNSHGKNLIREHVAEMKTKPATPVASKSPTEKKDAVEPKKAAKAEDPKEDQDSKEAAARTDDAKKDVAEVAAEKDGKREGAATTEAVEPTSTTVKDESTNAKKEDVDAAKDAPGKQVKSASTPVEDPIRREVCQKITEIHELLSTVDKLRRVMAQGRVTRTKQELCTLELAPVPASEAYPDLIRKKIAHVSAVEWVHCRPHSVGTGATVYVALREKHHLEAVKEAVVKRQLFGAFVKCKEVPNFSIAERRRLDEEETIRANGGWPSAKGGWSGYHGGWGGPAGGKPVGKDRVAALLYKGTPAGAFYHAAAATKGAAAYNGKAGAAVTTTKGTKGAEKGKNARKGDSTTTSAPAADKKDVKGDDAANSSSETATTAQNATSAECSATEAENGPQKADSSSTESDKKVDSTSGKGRSKGSKKGKTGKATKSTGKPAGRKSEKEIDALDSWR